MKKIFFVIIFFAFVTFFNFSADSKEPAEVWETQQIENVSFKVPADFFFLDNPVLFGNMQKGMLYIWKNEYGHEIYTHLDYQYYKNEEDAEESVNILISHLSEDGQKRIKRKKIDKRTCYTAKYTTPQDGKYFSHVVCRDGKKFILLSAFIHKPTSKKAYSQRKKAVDKVIASFKFTD
ncbi:putative transcriptional regulator [Elusimicrobium posterum]|uniref:hypothetical protein n=1 Tax=Elusimicrobium posterum TaxID=3116653 RepID=UPI003C70697A